MFSGATDPSDPSPRRPGSNPGGAIRVSGLLAWMAAALVAAPSAAQVSLPGASYERQVVLELFTAQGCSACPPADSMLAQLAMREDVIALALHVDYWDYIGWADTFALPEHTDRQKYYARRNGHSTIYTPQVIVNGADVIEGFRVMQVMNAIDQHRGEPAQIVLQLNRASSGALEIRAHRNEGAEGAAAIVSRSAHGGGAEALAASGRAGSGGEERLVLKLVRYTPSATVEIEAGENEGRRGEYHNIVTSWQTIGTWDMRSPLEMSVQIDGSDPLVVLIQERDQGEIMAAARLR